MTLPTALDQPCLETYNMDVSDHSGYSHQEKDPESQQYPPQNMQDLLDSDHSSQPPPCCPLGQSDIEMYDVNVHDNSLHPHEQEEPDSLQSTATNVRGRSHISLHSSRPQPSSERNQHQELRRMVEEDFRKFMSHRSLNIYEATMRTSYPSNHATKIDKYVDIIKEWVVMNERPPYEAYRDFTNEILRPVQ